MLAFLGLLSVFAFLSFLALLGLFGFFGFLTCTVADLSCNKESEKKCVEQKTNASKKHRLSQRPKRKERQRSRNEPKFTDDVAGKKIYCSQLNVHGFLDQFNLERMLTRMGINVLKFTLPKAFSTAFLRDKSSVWFDEYHPHASVVVEDVVLPMVHQVLKDHTYVIGSGKKISIAVIGDSTTAYCFDRRSNAVGGCEKWQLSSMIQEALGTTDVYVGFFSSSGSSFCSWDGFLAQTESVIRNEASFGCYDALVIVGGWNSGAVETTSPARRQIFSTLRNWSLGS